MHMDFYSQRKQEFKDDFKALARWHHQSRCIYSLYLLYETSTRSFSVTEEGQLKTYGQAYTCIHVGLTTKGILSQIEGYRKSEGHV